MRQLDKFRVTVPLRVRYAETDPMGVVYHANYLSWFHEARDQLLINLGVDIKTAGHTGYIMPVVEVSCRYHYPAHYRDEILVSAVPEETQVARFIVHYTVHLKRHSRLLAEGTTVNVLTTPEGKLLLRLPEHFQVLGKRLGAESHR